MLKLILNLINRAPRPPSIFLYKFYIDIPADINYCNIYKSGAAFLCHKLDNFFLLFLALAYIYYMLFTDHRQTYNWSLV